MKGKLKWLGIIFICMVLVFSFTVCDNGSGGNNNGGNNNGGTGNNGGNGGTGGGDTSATFTMNGYYFPILSSYGEHYRYSFRNVSSFDVSVTIGEETKIIPSSFSGSVDFNLPATFSSVTVRYAPSNKVRHEISTFTNGMANFWDR